MKKRFTEHFVTLLAKLFCAAVAGALLSACDFTTLLEPEFDAPVKNFFKDYTESAAIEKYESSCSLYQDADGSLCLDSSGLCTLSFFMRNPQRYALTPSVTFESLDESVDTSAVSINQTDDETIALTLPQSFLLAADEGKRISPTVALYEPKSGRSFPSFTVFLSCNSKPPFLYNATVLNNGGESFVIAFDMPEAAELSLRHKDLAFLTINGVSYELSVDSSGGFSFADSRFTRSWSENYFAVGSKIFTHGDRSVYFATGDAFENGDKEYTLILSDKAGLTSEVLASTKITKLLPPTLLDDANVAFADSSSVSISLLDGKEAAVIRLKAPESDQLGNAVSGTTVQYKLYNGTRTAATLYDSGSFSGSQDLSLKNGTWYLEAYASKTNYESSSPLKCNIYVSGATIYVSQSGSDDDDEADGTAALPFASLEKALSHIQSLHAAGMDTNVDWTIAVTGALSGAAGTADVNFAAGSAKSLLIAGSGDGAGSASIESLTASTAIEGFVLALKNLTVTGSLTVAAGCSVELLSGTSVAACSLQGGSLSLETGASVAECTVNGGTLSLGTGSSVSTCTLYDGNISLGDGTEVSAISWKSGTVTLTGNFAEDAQITVTPLVYAATEPQFLAAENAYNAANCEKFTVVDNDDTDDIKWFIAADGKLKQKLKASASGDGITFYENESDIAVQVEADGTLLTAGSASVDAEVWTFTAPDGYSCAWKVDGSPASSDSPYEGISVSGTVLTLNMRLWPTGVYDVFLAATKDGTLYSYHAQIAHTCRFVFGSNAASYIRDMTASGSVSIVGSLTASELAEINTAIQEKYAASSSFRLDLDLSAVTGLTEIPEKAFYQNKGLQSVVLPDGITSIGSSAFYYCENLTTINLPEGFTEVGDYAFYYCRKLTDVTFPDTLTSIGRCGFSHCSLTSVVLPEGLTTLGSEAFATNINLQSVSIPSTVTTIPYECFFNTELTSVTIAEGVENISEWAFWACDELTSIDLPGSIKSIHARAFDSAKKLAAINIDESNTVYKSIDGVVYTYNADGSLSLALYPRGKGTSYVIPSDANVTSIETKFCYWANDNSGFTELTIPVSVTTIKTDAFRCCHNLTSLNYTGTMAQWNEITKENGWKHDSASYGLGATVVHCSDGDVDLILFMTDVSNIKGAASDSSTFDQTVSGSGSETEPLIFSPSVDKIQIPLKTELTFTCDTTAANDICTVDAGTAAITLTLADNARSAKAGETGIIRILGSDNSHVIPVYVKVPAKTVSAAALSSLTEEEYEAVETITLDSTEGMQNLLDLVNKNDKTFEGKTITLADDVEMPSDTYFENAFSGTLNGNGKTISGLSGVDALFQTIDTNGVVENLTLRGSSTEAGFAYMVNGTVRNCISEVTVNATSGYVGGICGMTGGAAVIDSCINRGTITVPDAKYHVGGIVGYGDVLIRNCINEGDIIAANSDNVGGIVGKQIYTGIENCYNRGAVSGESNVGGICGLMTAVNGGTPFIKNCYSSGTVTGTTTTTGAILGLAEDSSSRVVSATYVYALTGTADRAIGAHSGDASADSAQLLSASEFATLHTSLNDWVTANTTSSTEPEYKSWTAGSDGYPAFAD